jgi:xanthine phosphoribosyltransferase
MEKYLVNSSDISTCIDILYRSILDSGLQFDLVIGIERGGIFVSNIISKLLRVPHETVKISCYDGEVLRDTPNIQICQTKLNKIKGYKKILVIDDLIDSGKTLHNFIIATGLKQSVDFYFGCLYYKTDNKYKMVPDFYCKIKPPQFIVFPWELFRGEYYNANPK